MQVILNKHTKNKSSTSHKKGGCVCVRSFVHVLTLIGSSCQHPARVIWSFGGYEVYWPIDGVLGCQERHRARHVLKNKTNKLKKKKKIYESIPLLIVRGQLHKNRFKNVSIWFSVTNYACNDTNVWWVEVIKKKKKVVIIGLRNLFFSSCNV